MSEAPKGPSRMVEAAGFAPASENTSPQESTMRIRFYFVAPDVEKRRRTVGSQPQKILLLTSEAPVSNQPTKMTSTPGPQADRGRRSQVLRLRERAACPQLVLFPSFVEGDGPRHASCETVPPSNLGRPRALCSS
jgi:hypothetical protein